MCLNQPVLCVRERELCYVRLHHSSASDTLCCTGHLQYEVRSLSVSEWNENHLPLLLLPPCTYVHGYTNTHTHTSMSRKLMIREWQREYISQNRFCHLSLHILNEPGEGTQRLSKETSLHYVHRCTDNFHRSLRGTSRKLDARRLHPSQWSKGLPVGTHSISFIWTRKRSLFKIGLRTLMFY